MPCLKPGAAALPGKDPGLSEKELTGRWAVSAQCGCAGMDNVGMPILLPLESVT